MNGGGYVNIYADIKVLKLGIDERIDAHAANARLKRPGRDWNLLTDFQRGLLTVNRANLRVLNQFCVAVADQRARRRRRNRHRQITGVEVAYAVEIDLVR